MADGKKILIIDDDSFLLDMYALKFDQSGYEVETELGSVPALEKLKSGYEPDIILLDIIMPQMDGFELLKKMQEENVAQSATLIVLSNRGQEDDISHGKELGADGYIVKANTTPSEVIDKVADITSQKE